MGKGWAADGFVAVDWGSSARRAYAVDAVGRVTDEMEDEAGALLIPAGGFERAIAGLRARFGERPFLMAGMIGSNRGWREAAYVPCPATLPDVAARLLWVEPGRTAIVPGLSLIDGQRADVMRGEEAQLFGLPALGVRGGRVFACHPGTHTKWVAIEDGAVTRFRTAMTGELFALLKAHSILADLLGGEVAPGPAFADGVARGCGEGAVAAELFAARARVLLGVGERADATAFVSGLLIGADVKAGLSEVPAGEPVAVVGRGSLVALYVAALQQCGVAARAVDGAQAFVAGMTAIAELLA
jgi:2-dehydro-3-deoxygalactonokinase